VPGLHLVATPIGAARDITLRALDILAGADVLAAEDTRTLRHLMEIHGIALQGRPLIAYHDHNGEAARPRLLSELRAGKSLAYASEAGTPLVADPGFQLARAAIAEGLPVLAAPGASAVLCALTVSGLPSDRFLFAGFLPNRTAARQQDLRRLQAVPATLIFYESPKRLAATLRDMVTVLGPDRPAAVCRELTKKFEEVSRASLEVLAEAFADREVKGEIVVLVDRGAAEIVGENQIDAAIVQALESLSVKDAAAEVAERLGLARRDVYQRALELGKKA
jgi:16S rRNA (cytidine1402-2'-O)-methyltransferase